MIKIGIVTITKIYLQRNIYNVAFILCSLPYTYLLCAYKVYLCLNLFSWITVYYDMDHIQMTLSKSSILGLLEVDKREHEIENLFGKK